MFLTSEEVTILTGKKRSPAQVTALRTMGIEHKIRPDGAVIISRSHVERVLDGNIINGLESKSCIQPNWKDM